jgi:hypothetical protein
VQLSEADTVGMRDLEKAVADLKNWSAGVGAVLFVPHSAIKRVRRRMLWDSEDVGLTEALAHPVGEVRRLGADAASVAGGWCVA